MGNPSLVLLDEPVEGVAPIVVQELGEQFQKLKDMGLTILFSEQNLRFARQKSDRASVIEKGRIKFRGTTDECHENPDIQKKFLMIEPARATCASDLHKDVA
jgi:branched-chain amino acid transport system ATP-binding protein